MVQYLSCCFVDFSFDLDTSSSSKPPRASAIPAKSANTFPEAGRNNRVQNVNFGSVSTGGQTNGVGNIGGGLNGQNNGGSFNSYPNQGSNTNGNSNGCGNNEVDLSKFNFVNCRDRTQPAPASGTLTPPPAQSALPAPPGPAAPSAPPAPPTQSGQRRLTLAASARQIQGQTARRR